MAPTLSRALLVLLVLAPSCQVLPDEVYFEAGQAPLADLHEALGGFDQYAMTVGFSWQLQPRDVVILGQRAGHPWDVGAMMGIYDGPQAGAPTPLSVHDDAAYSKLADTAADLNTQITTLSATVTDQAKDLKAVRETTDKLNGIIVWILSGGGITLLSLLGVGVHKVRTGRQTKTEEEPE
jgi:hypothetical protein